MKKFVTVVIAMLSVPAMAQDRVAKFDSNNDGFVSFVELSSSCEVSKSLFERADKNSDGVLSNSELRQAKAYLFSKCKEEKNA